MNMCSILFNSLLGMLGKNSAVPVDSRISLSIYSRKAAEDHYIENGCDCVYLSITNKYISCESY